MIPGTFSAKKKVGIASETTRKNSTNNLFRTSNRSLLPIELNPWQGGPPIIPARFFLFRPNRRFNDWPLTPAMSELRCIVLGKLRLWAEMVFGSTSIAPRTANPALEEPRLRPPTPQNRSTMPRGTVLSSVSGLDETTCYRLNAKQILELLISIWRFGIDPVVRANNLWSLRTVWPSL
jgi:hypothetical protein